jgi:hypothetical protein
MATTLPIRRVVLYKHGVGYFEREGPVSGSTPVQLSFKQREVSDVLKSLTVLDLNGGLVSAVSYDSTTPIEQLLAEIALSIPDAGSLVGLLPQLKGARVQVRPVAAKAPTVGVLLGIDTVDTVGDRGTTQQVRVSILTDTADVLTFDLFDLELQLLDEGIRRDLDFYLKTQLASKKKDARTFTLFTQGDGERTLRVSYVLESPVWKATYRILLNAEELPRIQGWAVVDNTSDEDWEEVDLTLVAGLPVSFQHDLYTPRYIRRPVVEVSETTGVLPPMAEAGVEFASSLMMDTDEEAPRGGRGRMRMAKAAAPAHMVRAISAPSSMPTQTRERQVGDLFEYIIEKPVTVRRNQSALVPILLKSFEGKSVLLYQKQARAENPMRCIDFENRTGLTLEGGPITVLDSGSYVGEAMLDTMKPMETRLVGYSVELSVRVLDTIESYSQNVSRVIIQQGTMITMYGQLQKTNYSFISKSNKEQTLYLDHPKPPEWSLVDSPAPYEITENFWRFRFLLSANTTTTFPVTIQRPLSQSFALVNAVEGQLVSWMQLQYLDAKTEKVIRSSFTIRKTCADFEKTIRDLETERNQLHVEQTRIRENLASLGDRASEKELRERYVRTLNQQEDRLEAIVQEAVVATAGLQAAKQELQTLFDGLALDHVPTA